jgi:hypothetical protein
VLQPESIANNLALFCFDEFKVVNNDAHAELGAEEYLKLWDANRLDHILYSWIRAVYLARIHCFAS